MSQRKGMSGRAADDRMAIQELRLRRSLRAIRVALEAIGEELRSHDEQLGNFFSEQGFLRATEGETDDT